MDTEDKLIERYGTLFKRVVNIIICSSCKEEILIDDLQCIVCKNCMFCCNTSLIEHKIAREEFLDLKAIQKAREFWPWD